MSFAPRVVADAPGGALVVFETADVDADLDAAIATASVAPYGRVLWPSASAVAAILAARPLAGVRVLELGCGTALCALVAARLGASVLATDVDPFALAAARRAADALPLAPGALETALFDVTSGAALPEAALVIAADLLYEPALAAALARRVREGVARGATFLVGDPGRAGRGQFVRLLADADIEATFRPAPGSTVDVAVIEPR